MSCPRYVLPVLGLAAVAPAQQPAPQAKVTITPEIYPVEPLTVHGEPRWHTVRVVAATTGRPIAGAELLLIAESPHPMRGEMHWAMRATADADGFVRLRADERAPGFAPWGWVAVRAPGHGWAMAMGALDEPLLPLSAGQQLPVCVRDWRGEPVANALLGACSGCGHTPDLAAARTGANGIAVLADVDVFADIFDLYVEHEALGLGYDGVDWVVGQGPVDFFVEPGTSSRGVVVDGDGKPVAGVHVGSHDVHRGPWTRTRADGSFALHGTEHANDLFVHDGTREVIFERPPVEPFRLVLPPPNGERRQVVDLPQPTDPGERQDVRVRVVGAMDADLAGATVRFVGPLPGATVEATWADGNGRTAELPPGRYTATATAPDHGEVRTEVDVRRRTEDEQLDELVFRPAPLPSCRVRVPNLPDDVNVWLGTGRQRRDVTAQVRNGAPIGLPDEPLWLVLTDRRARRTLVVDRARALADGVVRIAWFAPTRVEGALVDADGEPVAADLVLHPLTRLRGFVERDDSERDPKPIATKGQFSLASDHVGLALLEIRGAGARHGYAHHVPVLLPPRADDAVVDVGTIVLGGPPRLTLLDAAGDGFADGAAGLVRAGWHDVREPAPRFPVDHEGRWYGPPPRAGDAIEVRAATPETADGEPPVRDLRVRFPLTGDGPWSLTLPNGEVELDVRDERGEPLAATVFAGDDCVTVHGPTRLRRLRPGAQRLFVAAEKRQSAIVDVVVPADGARPRVDVALPPR
jgi:hypothetical protein